VAVFGSSASSSGTKVKTTFFPSIVKPALLISSRAKRAPFSLSLPKWAMGPVNGATWPILTSIPSAETAAALSSPLLHAVKINAVTDKAMALFIKFIFDTLEFIIYSSSVMNQTSIN